MTAPGGSGPGREPARVAFVCDYALDYLGGAQSAFLDQVRALRAAGHAVLVVSPGGAAGTLPDAPRWDVPARVTLPGVGLPVVRRTPHLESDAGRVLAAHRIEVVHLQSEFGLSAAVTAAARRAGLPVVQTVHTFFWRARVPAALQRTGARAVTAFWEWLTGLPAPRRTLADLPLDSALRGATLGMARRVDAVVSPSEHQARSLRAAGLPRVVTLSNVYDPGPDDPEPRPLEAARGPLHLVWVGRCAPEKRPLEFLAGCARAAARLGPGRFDVTVVGDGPLLSRCRALAARAGLPVTFTGRLPRSGVVARIRAAHLVALTSSGFDNQPMTVAEALSQARGVLYVDPRLTEGLSEAGILAPDPTPAGMAQALVDLVGDPGRVVAASRRAVRAARIFTPRHFTEGISRLYARL